MFCFVGKGYKARVFPSAYYTLLGPSPEQLYPPCASPRRGLELFCPSSVNVITSCAQSHHNLPSQEAHGSTTAGIGGGESPGTLWRAVPGNSTFCSTPASSPCSQKQKALLLLTPRSTYQCSPSPISSITPVCVTQVTGESHWAGLHLWHSRPIMAQEGEGQGLPHSQALNSIVVCVIAHCSSQFFDKSSLRRDSEKMLCLVEGRWAPGHAGWDISGLRAQ